MKRIEFFGPMGAGKTTLVDSIKNKKKLIAGSDFMDSVLEKKLANDYRERSYIKFFLFFIIKVTIFKNILLKNFDVYRFLNNNDVIFLNFVIDNYSRGNTNFDRYVFRLLSFQRDIAYSNLLNDHDSDSYVVFDEFLLQRVLTFTFNGFDEEFIRHCLSNINLPDVLVFVTASQNTLIKRVCSREGYIHSEQEVVSSFENSIKIIEILLEMGVEVIKIDTDNPFEECLSLLESFETY